MPKAIVVRGTLADPRHIELEEPVTGLEGPLEVTLKPSETTSAAPDVFDLIAHLPPGRRSKADIDAQVAAERASWGEP